MTTSKCPCCQKKVNSGYGVFVNEKGEISFDKKEGYKPARMGWTCYKRLLEKTKYGTK